MENNMVKAQTPCFTFHNDDYNWWIVAVGHVKFCTSEDYQLICKFCMKDFFCVWKDQCDGIMNT